MALGMEFYGMAHSLSGTRDNGKKARREKSRLYLLSIEKLFFEGSRCLDPLTWLVNGPKS